MVAVFAFLEKSWYVARAPGRLEAVTAPLVVDVIIMYLKQQAVEAVFVLYAILTTTGCPKKSC